MEHTYQIEGMTCTSCLSKVKNALESVDGIEVKSIALDPPKTDIIMKKGHISTDKLNEVLKGAGNYSIKEVNSVGHHMMSNSSASSISQNSGAVTYKPLIIILAYLIGFVLLSQVTAGEWNWNDMMSKFMGGFFIVFSFFKMLDVKGFAYSYSSYDIIAKKWIGYGFIYPFIELGLGIAYLMEFNMLITNAVTLVVMGVSTIGVLQSVMRKSKIQCACLGTVFNLPMSTVTLVEDALMVIMAGIMIILN